MSARLLRSRIAPHLFALALLAFVHWGAVRVGEREAGWWNDQGLWNPTLVAPTDHGIPQPVEVKQPATGLPVPASDNRRAGAGSLFGTLTLIAVLALLLEAASHFI